MLLIYTHQLSPRVEYIFNLLLEKLSGINFRLTTNKEDFLSFHGARFSYTFNCLNSELFFHASPLLFESDIKKQSIKTFDWNGLKVFFEINGEAALPYDPFAASFYLVSRYEEYLQFEADEYGRYAAKNSMAFANNFLQTPVVNHYAMSIKKILLKQFPQLSFSETKFSFISTIDIDNAYAYAGKGFYRTAGAISRSLLKADFDDLKSRLPSIAGMAGDPYNTYEYYFDLQKRYHFKSIFFFLLGDFTTHDKNLPHDSKKFISLIKTIASSNECGVHPSFTSNEKPGQLEKEINRFRNITGKIPTKSRQHFLKLSLPVTYRKLISAGITDDYTMGYHDIAGFRAGTCSAFYFFDLEKNEKTNLLIHPFPVMDATLNKYMQLKPDAAIISIKNLIDEIKSVNGTFISLWHNETLSETGIWKNWRKVFEFTVSHCSDV